MVNLMVSKRCMWGRGTYRRKLIQEISLLIFGTTMIGEGIQTQSGAAVCTHCTIMVSKASVILDSSEAPEHRPVHKCVIKVGQISVT